MTVRMMVVAGVVGGLFGAQGALAQQPAQKIDPSAKAVLDQAAAALSKLQSIEYTGRRWGEGDLMKAVPIDFTGSVKVIRSATDKTRCPMLLKGHSKSMGPKDDEFWFVLDGNGKMTAACPDDKKIYRDRPLDQRIPCMNQKSQGDQVLFDPYFAAEPFKTEASAEVIELEAPQEVKGQKCDVVKTTRKIRGGQGESTVRWYLGSEDHLPRRQEQIVQMGEQPIKFLFELWDVKVNTVKMADLVIQTPEGWTVEDYIPPPPPAPGAGPVDPMGQPNQQQDPVPPPVLGVEPGNVPPDFALSQDGKPVKRDDLKGNPAVIAFLWSRSIPSQKAVPVLGEVQEKYKASNLKVYGITPHEKNPADGSKFLADNKAAFPWLSGGDDALSAAYKVKAFPSFYVIGADGKVVGFVQNSDMETVKKKLEEMLQKASGNGGAAAAAGK